MDEQELNVAICGLRTLVESEFRHIQENQSSEFRHIQETQTEIKEILEKQNGRLRCVENEQASQKAWTGIIATAVGGAVAGVVSLLFPRQ